ncbi:MAG TPA: hypothetical protein VGN96_03935 [Roseococcus sp.]|jgi:hypothetical protein|nr:hypothetical protein [Roseococcus sp.]
MPDVVLAGAAGNLVQVFGEGESAVAVAARAARDAAQAAQVAAESAVGDAEGQADAAALSAQAAASSAGAAAGSASAADTSAQAASGSAGAAAGSASAAAGSASTATTQAGIATTQAGTATTQAGIATAGANTATTQAGIATTQANAAIAAAQNIPTPGTDPTETPRNADLGSAAFVAANALRGRWPVAAGAAYQITPDDWGRTLIAESGTLTWTLPLIAQLPDGWWVQVWNRSGNTLTINRAASAVIGASATSVTVADGAGLTLARRDDTRFERIA